ncbi:Dolichyl-diphosphooligosaccharide-protein glycosyltransferase subunit dad1 [Turnera subulata]|uniref:Dolichyl-diphosphooligosaccharide-protein glycosyltransferase subunit dad1 n=1 Tax=Turnera subulata TaxID=218843 RepID=A0A9Q0GEJ9_9ROSI|nr:Dolichyl-diphosphooligosaccharide-protein glycosyltransferase subunit dad1 [Turnera subulata]
MRATVGAAWTQTPCPLPSTRQPTTAYVKFQCYNVTQVPPIKLNKKFKEDQPLKNWQGLLDPIDHGSTTFRSTPRPAKLGNRWMEYQGIRNWEGMLDPLDDNLRGEILRYGGFVDAAYKAFEFDPSSPAYATCKYPKNSLLAESGLPKTGYRVTKHLRATSGIQVPRWMEKAPSRFATQSSWIGYVAVCQDKKEIARLGRRDVVIAYRGTATCLEWLENLRATLTHLPNADSQGCGPMVESGFLSLYTSASSMGPSLKSMVHQEIKKLLSTYGDEPLSLTITGHSLGAALATLTAYDVKTTFERAPLVTVVSFGGPRVGNRRFRQDLEKQGTKVLRIVNSDDLITKVPGFVIDGDNERKDKPADHAGLHGWIQKCVEDTQWVYADVGRELRLSSKDSPYLTGINVATCHDLKTYLHLVNGFVSSSCPFRATAKRVIGSHSR